MKNVIFVLTSAVAVFLASCASAPQPVEAPQGSLDSTINEVARVVESPAIVVRGFGIVAGLFGTGSAECPPLLRGELEKYIRQQLPEAGTINPRRFIDSLDTAVVEVLGVIPPMADAGQSFDVVVRPLSSTQTTSLEGGQLYATDLKEMSRVTQFNQFSRTIAKAHGAIFTARDGQSQEAQWYVLNGGHSLSPTTITLLLNQPDYVAAGAVRNRLNERFGARVANAVSPEEIMLRIPQRYRYDKVRFLTMIRQLHLTDEPTLRDRRIATLIEQLINETEKIIPETALEAVGKAALDSLAVLLDSEDAAVRFHAARCMSNIGDGRALSVLRRFVEDPASPYRAEAVQAIGRNVDLNDAEPILQRALAQEDLELRLAAYEAALAAKSSIVSRLLVADSIIVDRVSCGGPKLIYAMRNNKPGIVIFGSPIRSSDNIFLQSDDGQVTLNARPGDRFISVSRTHPNRPRVVGPISAGFELTQLIRALGESPEQKKGTTSLPGLSLSYAQIIDILDKLCETNTIGAHFVRGPMTTAGEMFGSLGGL